MKSVFVAFSVVAVLGVVACDATKADAVAVRVAALTYAFEHDSDTNKDRASCTFVVQSDSEQEEVVRSLSSYPISSQPLKSEARGSLVVVDARSGKRIVSWSLR